LHPYLRAQKREKKERKTQFCFLLNDLVSRFYGSFLALFSEHFCPEGFTLSTVPGGGGGSVLSIDSPGGGAILRSKGMNINFEKLSIDKYT
jgi:hypothetical protein